MALVKETVSTTAGDYQVELRQCDNTTCNKRVRPIEAFGWLYLGVSFDNLLPAELASRAALHGKDSCSPVCLIAVTQAFIDAEPKAVESVEVKQ